jgi:hypothetical protein
MTSKSETYRAKAAELRERAAGTKDHFLREQMLILAAQYEEFADEVEKTEGP